MRKYDDEEREMQRQRVNQLRIKYVLKARKGMSGPDMHKELRNIETDEPKLTDLQIASIVAYAFHPFNNPHMIAAEWEFEETPKADVPV